MFSFTEEVRFVLTSLVLSVLLKVADNFIILSNGTQSFEYNTGTRRSDKMVILAHTCIYIFYFLNMNGK